MKRENILIIGSNGQIGTALLAKLRLEFGTSNVIASDIKPPINPEGPFELIDATDYSSLAALVQKHKVSQIYHLAAVLSAKAEKDPLWAWDLNIRTLLNVYEVARQFNVAKVFAPSSIAVFGPDVPKLNTQQSVNLSPSTVYGVSKVAAECWSVYYHQRYGLDIRSLRYPGVIGYESMPGGGTTDYAVDMFHKAFAAEPYVCFLSEETRLPMIYMDDALRATMELMEAPKASITIWSSYNLSGLSFTPLELAKSIQSYFPEFGPIYHPDFRQDIADSWPQTIDDSIARNDWGWMPQYDLARMTKSMVENLSVLYHAHG